VSQGLVIETCACSARSAWTSESSDCGRGAKRISREQSARSFELRAALCLAKLDRGRKNRAALENDASANAEISALIEKLGFAPVDVGKLSEGGRLQQFGGVLTLKNLVQHPVPSR
jgi:predicted dinucleotide-binding enzyme